MASASIAGFNFVSLAFSVPFTVVDDDEANKVKFVLIYMLVVNSLKH